MHSTYVFCPTFLSTNVYYIFVELNKKKMMTLLINSEDKLLPNEIVEGL